MKHLIKNFSKKLAILLFLVSLISTQANGRLVQAAGTAHVTVETSSSSAGSNTDVVLNFYVTASSPHIYSLSFNAIFTGLTYRSYSAAGTAFNGTSQVASGGSVGSTNIEIAASYSGASPGGLGKVLVGRVTVRTNNTGATGQIGVTNIQAFDAADLEPMSVSGQGRSISVSAPAQPVEKCPAGQTGTPPNCTTQQSGHNHSGDDSNTQDQEKPKNDVAVPSTDGESGDPKIISEEEFDSISNPPEDQEQKVSNGSKSESSNNLWLMVAGGVIGLLAVITAALLFIGRRRRLQSTPVISAAQADSVLTTSTTQSSLEVGTIIAPNQHESTTKHEQN